MGESDHVYSVSATCIAIILLTKLHIVMQILMFASMFIQICYIIYAICGFSEELLWLIARVSSHTHYKYSFLHMVQFWPSLRPQTGFTRRFHFYSVMSRSSPWCTNKQGHQGWLTSLTCFSRWIPGRVGQYHM